MEPGDCPGTGGSRQAKKNKLAIERIRGYLADKDPAESEPPELIGSTDDVEEAWRMYTLMEATEWRFLPAGGGLGDQDDILLSNVFAIAARVSLLRRPNA